MPTTTAPEIARIVEAIRARRRFVLSSHARPDGDAIGSQLAMAYALRALGKEVHLVNFDRAPAPLLQFPGRRRDRDRDRVSGEYDAAIIMECGDLARTAGAGLDRFYGHQYRSPSRQRCLRAAEWFDSSAAACGEMVLDLIDALGVPLQVDIATHIYLAILTDTGSFHYSSISPRTFDICRRTLEAGVDPVLVARNVYDSNNMGRLKLFGSGVERHADRRDRPHRDRLLDHEMARAAGGTYEDTEGLINLPLTVKEIQAVVFFKQIEGDEYRVSMRSKGDIDIGAVAKEFGGGGHKNAAGCTSTARSTRCRSVHREDRAAIDGRPADH
jgi:phosphoesterase RecJ-like protein